MAKPEHIDRESMVSLRNSLPTEKGFCLAKEANMTVHILSVKKIYLF